MTTDERRAWALATQMRPEMLWDDYSPVEQKGWILIARAIRASDEAAGMVLVPREATERQLDAARDWSRDKYGKPIGNDAARGCYDAMVTAATEADNG